MGGGLVTTVRRALVAIGAGLAVAAWIRIRGTGGVPPQTGGWREIPVDEIRGTDPAPKS